MFRTEHAGPHPLKAEVTLLRRDRQTEESRKMPSRVAAVRGGWLSSLTNNTREDSEEACGLMLHSPARCHFYWHGWTASKCDKWFKSEVYIQGHSKLFKKKKKKNTVWRKFVLLMTETDMQGWSKLPDSCNFCYTNNVLYHRDVTDSHTWACESDSSVLKKKEKNTVSHVLQVTEITFCSWILAVGTVNHLTYRYTGHCLESAGSCFYGLKYHVPWISS